MSAKRNGAPIDRAGITGALFRINNGPGLKYLSPYMTLCEKLRLPLIADTLLKIRPHDNLALDAAHRCNPRAIAIMNLWARADDADLHTVVLHVMMLTTYSSAGLPQLQNRNPHRPPPALRC